MDSRHVGNRAVSLALVCLLLGGGIAGPLRADPSSPADVINDPALASYSKLDRQKLQLSLRAETILYQLATQATEDEEKGEKITDANWVRRIRAAEEKIADSYEAAQLTPRERTTVLGFMYKISLGPIVSMGRAVGAKIGRMASAHGAPLAICFALGWSLKIGLSVGLTAAGHPELTPAAALFPFGKVLYGTYELGMYKYHRAKLAKLYGGKENLERIEAEYKKVAHELHMRSYKDVLGRFYTDKDVERVVVIQKDSLWTRMLEGVGLRARRLSYKNLKRFIHDNVPETLTLNWDAEKKRFVLAPDNQFNADLRHFVEALDADTEHDPQAKALVLLDYIWNRAGQDYTAKLEKTFSSEFHPYLSTHADAFAARPWLERFAEAKNIHDVLELMKEAPANIPARLIVRVFKEAILPVLKENLTGLRKKEWKNLEHDINGLLAKTENDPSSNWNEHWNKLFADYMKAAAPGAYGASVCQSLGNLARAH